MAEFGKRKIKPGEGAACIVEPPEKPKDRKAPRWFGLLAISLFSIFCGFAILALFNQAAVGFLKNSLLGHSHRIISASYQDTDMYTGVSAQRVYVFFRDDSGEHPEDKRNAEKLANDAIKLCHAALKKDIARRKRQGEVQSGAENASSYEPLLDDLGVYLPCLMTVNKRRFCSPNQKKDLVRRVEAYLTVVKAARRHSASRAPLVNTSSLSDVFFGLSEDMGGDHFRVNYTPNVAQLSPDARLLAALEDLIALGYLDLADFAAFFGLYVSDDIKQLFAKVKKQEKSCKS